MDKHTDAMKNPTDDESDVMGEGNDTDSADDVMGGGDAPESDDVMGKGAPKHDHMH
jgi:hypothetical protein